jgi:hypothetical protein
MWRHVNVGDLPSGVLDHEEHVQRSERGRSDTEEVARPDLRPVLPQELPPSGGRPTTMSSLHILGDRSGRNLEPKSCKLRLDPPLTPKSVLFAYFVDRRCRQATIEDVAKELHLDWHAVEDLDKQYMAAQLAPAGYARARSDRHRRNLGPQLSRVSHHRERSALLGWHWRA